MNLQIIFFLLTLSIPCFNGARRRRMRCKPRHHYWKPYVATGEYPKDAFPIGNPKNYSRQFVGRIMVPYKKYSRLVPAQVMFDHVESPSIYGVNHRMERYDQGIEILHVDEPRRYRWMQVSTPDCLTSSYPTYCNEKIQSISDTICMPPSNCVETPISVPPTVCKPPSNCKEKPPSIPTTVCKPPSECKEKPPSIPTTVCRPPSECKEKPPSIPTTVCKPPSECKEKPPSIPTTVCKPPSECKEKPPSIPTTVCRPPSDCKEMPPSIPTYVCNPPDNCEKPPTIPAYVCKPPADCKEKPPPTPQVTCTPPPPSDYCIEKTETISETMLACCCLVEGGIVYSDDLNYQLYHIGRMVDHGKIRIGRAVMKRSRSFDDEVGLSYLSGWETKLARTNFEVLTYDCNTKHPNCTDLFDNIQPYASNRRRFYL